MKKLIGVIILAVVAIGIFAGCSSDSKKAKADTKPVQTIDSIAFKNLGASAKIEDKKLTLSFIGFFNINDEDNNKVMEQNITKMKNTLYEIKNLNNFKGLDEVYFVIDGNLKFGKDNSYHQAHVMEVDFQTSDLKNMDLKTISNKDFMQKQIGPSTINPTLKEKFNDEILKTVIVK